MRCQKSNNINKFKTFYFLSLKKKQTIKKSYVKTILKNSLGKDVELIKH